MALPERSSTHLITAHYSFIGLERMKGWVGRIYLNTAVKTETEKHVLINRCQGITALFTLQWYIPTYADGSQTEFPVTTSRSQHSQECKDSRWWHCSCDWPRTLTFWSRNKRVSRTHRGTFVFQVWCIGFWDGGKNLRLQLLSCGYWVPYA